MTSKSNHSKEKLTSLVRRQNDDLKNYLDKLDVQNQIPQFNPFTDNCLSNVNKNKCTKKEYGYQSQGNKESNLLQVSMLFKKNACRN